MEQAPVGRLERARAIRARGERSIYGAHESAPRARRSFRDSGPSDTRFSRNARDSGGPDAESAAREMERKLAAAQGFRNSGAALKEDAPLRAAAAQTRSRLSSLSLISGITGCASTLTGTPASVSFLTASKRSAGRGARGSIRRARASSSVVMVRCTRILFFRAIRGHERGVARHQIGLGGDAEVEARARRRILPASGG